MRRASRIILNAATSASLAVLVIALLLWVSSYLAYFVVGRGAYSGIGTELISVSGRFVFYRYNSYRHEPPPQKWAATVGTAWSSTGQSLRREFGVPATAPWWNRAGFRALSRELNGPGTSLTIVTGPYWFLVLATLPLTWRAVTQWRSSRRARALASSARCPACGYDLRATPDRCPECGKMARPAPSAT